MASIERYKDNEMDWQQIRERSMPKQNGSYRRITLIYETYNHCRDKDAFLRHFFASVDLMICGNENESNFNEGLGFMEKSLANETTYDEAKLLLTYADDLLIFYVKSKFIIFYRHEYLLTIFLK